MSADGDGHAISYKLLERGTLGRFLGGGWKRRWRAGRRRLAG